MKTVVVVTAVSSGEYLSGFGRSWSMDDTWSDWR